MATLDGKNIAILATNGFEYSELTEPKKALEEEGAQQTEVIAPQEGSIKGESKGNPAPDIAADKTLDEADASAYDALLLPGGVKNPDTLRMNEKAVAFVKAFVDAGKPVAAICHGPWTLINAGGVEGKRMTSWPSLQKDLENAGAEWVDEQVVVDGPLVTSRRPDDIPAFNQEMIELFAEV